MLKSGATTDYTDETDSEAKADKLKAEILKSGATTDYTDEMDSAAKADKLRAEIRKR